MTTEEAALEYERLIRAIHALPEDELDGPEREALCDEMDLPWHAMSNEDQRRMRKLSSQLNRERYPERHKGITNESV